jgi:hypothetical protein
MALDGFSVGGACVVTPAGSSVGQSAIDVWSSLNDNMQVDGVGSLHQFVYSSGGAVLPNGHLSFIVQDVVQTLTTEVNLAPCDSSIYPVRGLDVLAPDVPTAITLVVAIWLVWTAGFAIRMLRKSLGSVDEQNDSD